jgi:hypothetical protein
MDELKNELELLCKSSQDIQHGWKTWTQKNADIAQIVERNKSPPTIGDIVVILDYRQIFQISSDRRDFVLNSLREATPEQEKKHSNQLLIETLPNQPPPFYCPTNFVHAVKVSQEELVERFIHCSCPLLAIELFPNNTNCFGMHLIVARKVSLHELKHEYPNESQLISTSSLGYTWVDVFKQDHQDQKQGPDISLKPNFQKIGHLQIFSFVDRGTCYHLEPAV